MGQRQAQDQRGHAHQQRLPPELADKLSAGSAQRLAHADFLSAKSRPAQGHVDGVDTGDEQKEEAERSQHIRNDHVALWKEVEQYGRIQIDFG